MGRRTYSRLREEIARLRRRGGIKAFELERIARSLGRRRHDRGKEPTWISELLPDARPISIPSHRGDLNKYTARRILELLDADLDLLEARETGEDDA